MSTSNVIPRSSEIWSKQEKWVWLQLIEGEVADLDKYLTSKRGHLSKPDSKKERIISGKFLHAIFSQDIYEKQLTSAGIIIKGACFESLLDMQQLSITRDIVFNSCLFKSGLTFEHAKAKQNISILQCNVRGVSNFGSFICHKNLFLRSNMFNHLILRSSQITGQLSFTGSTIAELLDMDGIKVSSIILMRNVQLKNLNMRGAHFFDQYIMEGSTCLGTINMDAVIADTSIFLNNSNFSGDVSIGMAYINSELEIIGSIFKNELKMPATEVKGSIYLDNSKFMSPVNLNYTKIGRNLKFRDSVFESSVCLDSIFVGGDVSSKSIQSGTYFSELHFSSAKIEGQISFQGTEFSHRLHMDSTKIGNSLFLQNTNIEKWADLLFLQVGSNLDISGSALEWLDLTGTDIIGELRISSEKHDPVKWKESASIILRNTHTGTLQDQKESWPANIEQEGFTYERLGGFLGEGMQSDIANREVSWFISWLSKSKRYSPKPYEQLAKVLHRAGYTSKANDVLYSGKERERKQENGKQKTWMFLLNIFIGYGYKTYYSIFWIFGLTLIGTILLLGVNELNSWIDRFFYSLDMLLPIIVLDKVHESIKLSQPLRVYFYFVKIIGFVLASFIVAGLSGLTKRSQVVE